MLNIDTHLTSALERYFTLQYASLRQNRALSKKHT